MKAKIQSQKSRQPSLNLQSRLQFSQTNFTEAWTTQSLSQRKRIEKLASLLKLLIRPKRAKEKRSLVNHKKWIRRTQTNYWGTNKLKWIRWSTLARGCVSLWRPRLKTWISCMGLLLRLADANWTATGSFKSNWRHCFLPRQTSVATRYIIRYFLFDSSSW